MALTITLLEGSNSYSLPIGGGSTTELHTVVGESRTASLVWQIESNLCQFTAGDIGLTADNADGFWTAELAGLDASLVWSVVGGVLTAPARLYRLQISKAGSVVWEGDLDPISVQFDVKQRRVSMTFLGAFKRLSFVSCDSLKRRSTTQASAGVGCISDLWTGQLSGTPTSGQLKDSIGGWANDQWQGWYVVQPANATLAIVDVVVANTSDTLVFAGGATPSAGIYMLHPYAFFLRNTGVTTSKGTPILRTLTLTSGTWAPTVLSRLVPGEVLRIMAGAARPISYGPQIVSDPGGIKGPSTKNGAQIPGGSGGIPT